MHRRLVVWAAEAPYDGTDGLRAALTSLTTECPSGIGAVALALDSEMSECKVVERMPFASSRELRRHVALEAGRYFLGDAARLTTTACLLSGQSACLAAAPSDVLEAVCGGLSAGRLHVTAVAPAMLWWSSTGDVTSVLESHPGLDTGYSNALASAIGATPLLRLIPAEWFAKQQHVARRSAMRWFAACMLLALGLAITSEIRLILDIRQARAQLTVLLPRAEKARNTRAGLDSARHAVGFLTGQLGGSNLIGLLAELSAALPDSAVVSRLQVDERRQMILEVRARRATNAIQAIAAMPRLRNARLDGPVTRETLGNVDWERFLLRAELTR